MKINRTVIFTILAWMILIAMSFLWNYTNAIQERERTALNAAKGFFDHIVITRLWNARHGGVYVPVTEEMQPNSYLDIPMRDIEVNDKLKLTKVNPAYMTRQISEIAKEQDGVEFHMTSLMPIRPQNKPTVREEEFLREFDKGVKEKGVFIKDGSNDYFFYMAPLLTSKSCLECHAEQGYKEGDVRGGISVTFPFDPNILIFPLLSGHIVIGFIGILGIVIAGGRLNKAYETIKIQAIFDSLTGVPNRRSFSRKILEEYKRSKRYHESMSIIMCDIDNFKTYNDTYGHSRGDDCLRKVAQQIQSSLHRPGDF
ncbi:MAG: DUF3365 domain-containing protein, partial [Nitrospira sp.]|nr:DUF3365 domain-containing protein [Nitrospira sp.]